MREWNLHGHHPKGSLKGCLPQGLSPPHQCGASILSSLPHLPPSREQRDLSRIPLAPFSPMAFAVKMPICVVEFSGTCCPLMNTQVVRLLALVSTLTPHTPVTLSWRRAV